MKLFGITGLNGPAPQIKLPWTWKADFVGKPFWEEVGKCGSCIVSIAGTAHWQAGKIERHNQIIKDMLKQVINHTQAKGKQDMEEVAMETVLLRTHSLGNMDGHP